MRGHNQASGRHAVQVALCVQRAAVRPCVNDSDAHTHCGANKNSGENGVYEVQNNTIIHDAAMWNMELN